MFAALMFKNPRVPLSIIEQHTLGCGDALVGLQRQAWGGLTRPAVQPKPLEEPLWLRSQLKSTPVHLRLRREGLISVT